MDALLPVLLLFSLALAAVGALFIVAQFLSLFTAAPFVPSATERVEAMMAFADLRPGERAADLGSGDGRVVIAAARRGALAEGWEANPLLAVQSAVALRRHGIADRASIRARSYRGRDFRHLDAVFCYLLPEEMARLERWLPAAMKPGSRVVAHSFPFPTWTPEAKRGAVYLYRVPAADAARNA